MRVEDSRVRFERAFVMEQVAKTPATFELQARNRARNVILGGDNVVTAPVYGPPFVTDLQRGRRGATIEDFTNFDKLSQAVEQIHCAGGTTVEPEDLPLGTRHLDMVYSHIRWTDKPFMGSVISAENARDTVEMASIVCGGRESIEKTPAVISLINVNSPLRYDDRMLGALLEYSEAGQPVIVTPFLMAGAMSPMGLAGTVAQQTAEALAGIALVQLIRPGTPSVYGSFLTNTDMQSGSPAFGTPESAMGILASAQMARHYNLPFRGGTNVAFQRVAVGTHHIRVFMGSSNTTATSPLGFDPAVVSTVMADTTFNFAQDVAQTFVHENRIRQAASSLGAAQFCINEAVAYANQRQTWGRPLSRNQAIQFPLVELHTEAAMLRQLVRATAWALDRQHHMEVTHEVAMCNYRANRLACDAADRAMQTCGGLGYSRHMPFEHIYRHHRRYRITEGSEEIQMRKVGQQLFGLRR